MPVLEERWLPTLAIGYEVSDFGRVRSYRRGGRRSTLVSDAHVLKGRVDSEGYRSVELAGRIYNIHRLVLEAFIGPAPEGMVGCHQNGDKLDCRLTNLRWDTRPANEADKIAHGRTNRGERQGRHKLTEVQAREILMSEESSGLLARRFGVSQALVYEIWHRRSWAWLDPHVPPRGARWTRDKRT